MLLHSNGCGADRIENTAYVVEEASWALHGNDRCLQSHRLATGLYATIYSQCSLA